MTNQIRIFLGFLGLIALVSVFTFLNSFRSSSSTFLKPLTGSVLEVVDQDTDKDGLTNREESYWNTDFQNPDTDGDGFLDGEEVASGHDPLKPGPDDFLPTGSGPENINVTDKISTLLVSGFYAGDLNESTDSDIYNEAMGDIRTELLISGAQALDPSNIPLGQVKFSSDSKKAQEEYLTVIGSIIRVNLWGELVNEPRIVAEKFSDFDTEDLQSASSRRQYFNSKADYYKSVINKVNALAVPPSWFDIHQQLLSDLQTLAVNHQALGQMTEDPLKGLLAMNNLVSVYQEVQPFLLTVTTKIKENNLNPPNEQLWVLIKSLTNDF